tara:strand:+ start:395 stop:961 length:567 start_codon:yes stop_codon:yes gene_type:complete
MKILNLYAGIGGNRKRWGDEHEIVAVEIDEEIAGVYKSFYPNDVVVVGDAHQYLLDHYEEFDFIWSSPPCPTHSKMCFSLSHKVYCDMRLYQEIIFLKTWFKGKWVVENVKPYYKPLIEPEVDLARHLFWSNFTIEPKKFKQIDISRSTPQELLDFHRIKKPNVKHYRKVVRNMVHQDMGLHILLSLS